MNARKKAELNNYNMAFGRIGLCLIFPPIIIALSFLLAMDEHTSKLVPLTLLCLCIPFMWIALTVPISVKLDDGVSVRYLCYRVVYSRRDVTGVHFSETSTSFGVGALVPYFEVGFRQHRLGQINFSNRKPISIKVDDEKMEMLQGWYDAR